MSHPSPQLVQSSHTKLGLEQFRLYANTYSFSLGPFRESLDSLEKENEEALQSLTKDHEFTPRSVLLMYGTLRTGQKVYTEVPLNQMNQE